MAKMGRPSAFTTELGERICHSIAEGKSLRSVLLPDDMPSRNTVYRWISDFPEFGDSLAHAREAGADFHADAGLDELYASKGESKDVVAAAREIARYHMGLAKVFNPRLYGDHAKIAVEHSGSVQGGLGPVIIQITAHAPAAPVVQAIDVVATTPALEE